MPNDRASSPEQDKDMQQERSSETAVWLHGTMSIEVLGAVGLPRHRVLLSCRQQVMTVLTLACLRILIMDDPRPVVGMLQACST